MNNPALVGEPTTDDVLLRRHQRATDLLYQGAPTNITFRGGVPVLVVPPGGPPSVVELAPRGFPIIYDTSGTDGNVLGAEASDAIAVCQRAWQRGDALYLDANNNGVVDDGIDTLLSTDLPVAGRIEPGHNGVALVDLPASLRSQLLYIDNVVPNNSYDVGEHNHRSATSVGLIRAAPLERVPQRRVWFY
jgi:hypothetical protein